jgi:DNA-binding transcriptional regulator YdaS (Cro superfamily)
MDTNTRETILKHASMNRIAKYCKVSPQAVRAWLADDGRVPAKHCPAVVYMVRNDLTVEQLRPDLDWKRDKSGAVIAYQVRI